MRDTLEFTDLLRLIEERTAAFVAAVASAPSLDAQVPTCPEWTLYDLVRHLGEGRRHWAATVPVGPSDTRPPKPAMAAPPREREALLAWMTESSQRLLAALREVGPDRECWVGWRDSQSPATTGAVARHQVQEIAIHTYDAQVTAGAPQPLPEEVALDGVDEVLTTCVATTTPWPHEPAIVEYHVTEGHSWRLWLDGDGARSAQIPAEPAEGVADVIGRPTASNLILAIYNRVSNDTLALEGDVRVIDRLVAWDPS